MKEEFKVIDNFLDEKYFSEIEDFVMNYCFWLYIDDISDLRNEKSLGSGGFYHPVYGLDNAVFNTIDLFKPLLKKIEEDFNFQGLIRSRLDMTTINVLENKKYSTHVDYERPHFSSIFYLNDSDGDTVLYSEKYKETNYPEKINDSDLNVLTKISPKKNRLLVFDGELLHTGHGPHKNNRRIILNSNFI